MKRKIIIILAICTICPLLYAGVMGEMKCSNKQCMFKAKVYTGRGKVSIIVPGYCVHCKKMVSVSFKHSKQKPLAKVWDSTTGKVLDLYKCPNCNKPFAEAKKIVFCPKCNKKTISTNITGKWD